MNNVIKDTLKMFESAIPKPIIDNQNVQLGCHIEEFLEMLEEIEIPMYNNSFVGLKKAAKVLSEALKTDKDISIVVKDRKALLDAMTDQIVTATGVGYMYGMDSVGALNEVNRSNFSKFENGLPVFNENNKLKKGAYYTPPELEPYVGNDPVL